MLDLSLAPTTQLRPSQLRPSYTSSRHAHTRTELLEVMRVILQAHLYWEETIRIVFSIISMKTSLSAVVIIFAFTCTYKNRNYIFPVWVKKTKRKC